MANNMTREQQDMMVHALIDFLGAYETLRDRMLDIEVNDLPAMTLYPFDDSFDELGVPEWICAMVRDIRG